MKKEEVTCPASERAILLPKKDKSSGAGKADEKKTQHCCKTNYFCDIMHNTVSALITTRTNRADTSAHGSSQGRAHEHVRGNTRCSRNHWWRWNSGKDHHSETRNDLSSICKTWIHTIESEEDSELCSTQNPCPVRTPPHDPPITMQNVDKNGVLMKKKVPRSHL